MKNFLRIVIVLITIFSCQREEIFQTDEFSTTDLHGAIESINVTKTSMDENNNVLWSMGDQLVAFMRTTLAAKYQVKEQYVGSATGGFSKITDNGNNDDLETGQEIDHNIIWYPYSDNVWCMKNDNFTPTKTYKLNVLLLETQKYVKNSFGIGSFPMIAVSASNQLTFKNVCGGIKLQLKGIDKIKTIKFEGLGGELISGKATVVGHVDGSAPSIMMASEALTSVTLDCGDGVQLNEDTATTFIISLPPTNFQSGMKITVTDTDGLSRELINRSSNKINRSALLTFPVITYTQEGVFELPEGALTSYEFIAEGGTADIPLITNQSYKVIIPEDAKEWINYVDTKALREETISLVISENTTPEERSAEVLIATTEGVTLQTINIAQEPGEEIVEAINISSNGTSNCYIIKDSGCYKFIPTKGNSSERINDISKVEVLWETFGTNTSPNVGDLISNVSYTNGNIVFETPSTFKEGNAVIAAKDASGTILWSWHIWFTSEGYQEQEYANNAGTLMDRNLGATSSEPGNASTIGLLYQWGRKDPFVGSTLIDDDTPASTTADIQYVKVLRTTETGSIEYSITHPTSFIYCNSYDGRYDWCETEDHQGAERWQDNKTIYDPCPVGWKVPKGGENGIWQSAGFPRGVSGDFDKINFGMSFSDLLTGNRSWFPASGRMSGMISSSYARPTPLNSTGYFGRFWTSTLYDDDQAYALHFDADISENWGYVNTMSYQGLYDAYPVRCIKEGTDLSTSDNVTDLSKVVGESANSYLVGHSGKYKFPTVKGNSDESVGEIATVEVLWESYRGSSRNIIDKVEYSANYITFNTGYFQDGNAVIAAKNVSGTILWSWHIWFSSNGFKEIKYNNNAGIMMDRNLGATSSQPGVSKSLGLLYQWGRKDPFLSGANRDDDTPAKCTLDSYKWSYNSSCQSMEYAIRNPYYYICGSNDDWCSDPDEVRWSKDKTIYDPCPPGWRVPDGGENGLWAKADMVYAESIGNEYRYKMDSDNKGITLLETICSPETWYPTAGYKSPYDSKLGSVGISGGCWSCTESEFNINNACYLDYNYSGYVNPTNTVSKSTGLSVRCQKD